MTASVAVSIAMATYNGARYIREQLDSFVAQTRRPDELVITDDGSTDETLSIIRDFAASAPFPVRLSQNLQRLDYARNFERAISLCSGDIILLSDQDDVWFPEKLKTIEQWFEARPDVQVIINDALLTDVHLVSTGNTQRKNIRRAGNSDKLFFTGCCSAHRREWRQFALPIPGTMPAHDYWINLLAIEMGCALHIPDVLQVYRRHESNASTWMLSDPKGVSFWRAVTSHWNVDARSAWNMRARLLAEILRRAGERPQQTNRLASAFDVQMMQRQLALLKKRIELASKSRAERAIGVVSLWSSGAYDHFEGWKSMIKDLLRA
jgi:glycosyltransferase involved in cell wall biosynthesis